MQPGQTLQMVLLAAALVLASLSTANAAADTVADESQSTSVAPEVSAAEINHLLSEVENSGCQFTRNGRTHNGEKAAKHLRKKYNYGLRKYDHITAEQFIEHIASKSSWTGKTYTLECEDGVVIESSQWLTEQLDSYRASPDGNEQKPASTETTEQEG